MNKAFVREIDPLNDRCPRCGVEGIAMGRVTLDAQLPVTVRQDVGETGFFCPSPQCEIVYFDTFERTVRTFQLPQAIYPKDPSAPLCACFGISAEEVEEDARQGNVQRVRALIDQSSSPEARCSVTAASGQNCAAELQRCFLRCYQQG